MLSDLIEYKVKNDINAIIKEPLTVNDEVLRTSDDVAKRILSDIKEQTPKPFTDGGNKREMSFQAKVFNDKIKVFVNAHRLF